MLPNETKENNRMLPQTTAFSVHTIHKLIDLLFTFTLYTCIQFIKYS